MTEALKPCPFCGGGAVISADMNSHPDAACDSCGANTSGRGVDGAIAAWNRRADLVDPAAIREAALREAAGVAHKCVKAFGAKMRAAPNKQEKRDWQSMLMGAVDIEHAILALIDKKEG